MKYILYCCILTLLICGCSGGTGTSASLAKSIESEVENSVFKFKNDSSIGFVNKFEALVIVDSFVINKDFLNRIDISKLKLISDDEIKNEINYKLLPDTIKTTENYLFKFDKHYALYNICEFANYRYLITLSLPDLVMPRQMYILSIIKYDVGKNAVVEQEVIASKGGVMYGQDIYKTCILKSDKNCTLKIFSKIEETLIDLDNQGKITQKSFICTPIFW